ncbi:MAG: hypothetical protein A2505_01400 [Deltaproteobacteria bacterium RIFOXYD12_FULL_55_16]|nr:MAG: hypothetical protein A2505_01400 [Deltaproteobacteria bacterium RIFOXYD12_FULL_55_16]
MNGSVEACLNIWFIVDQDSKLIYRAAARAYALPGSDDDKALTLKRLAMSDYHLANHFSLSKYKTKIVDQQGQQRELPGLFNNASFEAVLPIILDTICKDLEKQFVEQPRVTSEGGSTYKLKIPKEPYYVMTYLSEDSMGRLIPRL